MQRYLPLTRARFLASQFHELGCQLADVRESEQRVQSGHSREAQQVCLIIKIDLGGQINQ